MIQAKTLVCIGALLLIAACTPSGDTEQPTPTDIAGVAEVALTGAETTREKVEAAIGWTHSNMNWTSTDYEQRTVEEILERGGGNCFEQAQVVRAMLNDAGVRTREVREVNVQPASEQRANDSEEMIARNGFAASVFGRNHNDHVWVEYYDAESDEWHPADPTLNVIGRLAWVRARMGFGDRPVHDVIPFADMLVPAAVFVRPDGEDVEYESRVDFYLIDGFAAAFPNVVDSPHWADWQRQVRALTPLIEQAFNGEHNLHENDAQFVELYETYRALGETIDNS